MEFILRPSTFSVRPVLKSCMKSCMKFSVLCSPQNNAFESRKNQTIWESPTAACKTNHWWTLLWGSSSSIRSRGQGRGSIYARENVEGVWYLLEIILKSGCLFEPANLRWPLPTSLVQKILSCSSGSVQTFPSCLSIPDYPLDRFPAQSFHFLNQAIGKAGWLSCKETYGYVGFLMTLGEIL